MLLDALNRFSDKQAVSATAVSENVLDLRADRDLAVFSALEVVAIPCTKDGSALEGEGTLAVSVETSETEDFATAEVLVQSAPVTAEQLNKGPIGIKLPYGGKRFLRLNYTVNGAITGLLLTSGLTIATPHDIHYPRAMHN